MRLRPVTLMGLALLAFAGWLAASGTAASAASCDAAGNACLPAIPCTIAGECLRGAVFDALNVANAAYRAALLNLSTDALSPYWAGDAYAQAAQQVGDLQSQGVYAVVRLLSISAIAESYRRGSAAVRTCENWLVDSYDPGTGALVGEDDQLVDNRYQLVQTNGLWQITEDATTVLTTGCPLSAGNLTVTVQNVASDGASPAVGVDVLAVPAGDATAPPVASGTSDAAGVVALSLPASDYWLIIPQPASDSAPVAQAQSYTAAPDGTPVAQWTAVTITGSALQSVTLSISQVVP
ncbi:MAG TPA: hypothetical protein VFA70_15810 [Dehalococcoidia bacterium]|nr:hypothetical protein [Dehalococcoidia bacterium]